MNLATTAGGCLLGIGIFAGSLEAPPPRTVEVAQGPDGPWQSLPTRTLEDLPEIPEPDPVSALSRYGGLKDRRLEATGFFRVARHEGRWWLVDPEGCLYLYRGISSVRLPGTDAGLAALDHETGGRENWAHHTAALLRNHGFTGAGAWSDGDRLEATVPRVTTVKIWNFMSAYGKQRGGTFQQAGHTGYPNDCIFVFDPGFEGFCDEYARQLEAGRDDPWFLGHFSDNELPLKREALRNYLALPAGDPGREAARSWLRDRRGKAQVDDRITPEEEAGFLEMLVDRYFEIVSRAIRRHDPNHLFLGARFHGGALKLPEVFRAAGTHVDVLSVNYYRAWTPDPELLVMWERESGRPVLLTEWYAKGADSGMANRSGAGWVVRTQRDRGRFYQNFTLALLESRVCVGWDWFKYMDNDPDDRSVDPSNTDSNKGILSNRGRPYEPLLDLMAQLNARTYALIDRFDSGVPPGSVDGTPGSASALKPWVMPPPPEGVVIRRDVAYLPPDRPEKADLYLPSDGPDGTRLPAVVIIHGGGFNDGDKARPREFNIGTFLARNGYIGMSINYRLTRGSTAPTWPQPVEDAFAAVEWLGSKDAGLPVDPDRVGAIGGSAGGTLASLLAFLPSAQAMAEPAPSAGKGRRVRCAIDLYGPADLLAYHDMKAFGGARAELPGVYRAASPITHVHANAAPLLIVHGTDDGTVDYRQSVSLAAALREVGAEHELVLIPGAGHSFDLQPSQRDLRPLVLQFLDRHLKHAKTARSGTLDGQ